MEEIVPAADVPLPLAVGSPGNSAVVARAAVVPPCAPALPVAVTVLPTPSTPVLVPGIPNPPSGPPEIALEGAPASAAVTPNQPVAAERVNGRALPFSGHARRAKFSRAMDLHLLRAVASSQAHLAGYGAKQDAFDRVAADCKAAACFTHLPIALTGKSVRDRYRKLMADFRKDDKAQRALSGTDDEEVTELTELLADLAEGEDDATAKREAEKEKKRGIEERLVAAGSSMRDMALKRHRKNNMKQASKAGGSHGSSGDSNDDDDVSDPGTSRRTGSAAGLEDDVDLMREHSERETKRAEVERENMEVAKGTLEATREFGERGAKHNEEMAKIERERIQMEKDRLEVESERLRIETERVRGEAASRREELAQASKRADAAAKRDENALRIRQQELALAERKAAAEGALREAEQKERTEMMRAMLNYLAKK